MRSLKIEGHNKFKNKISPVVVLRKNKMHPSWRHRMSTIQIDNGWVLLATKVPNIESQREPLQ
jgi:hypothetical protein